MIFGTVFFFTCFVVAVSVSQGPRLVSLAWCRSGYFTVHDFVPFLMVNFFVQRFATTEVEAKKVSQSFVMTSNNQVDCQQSKSKSESDQSRIKSKPFKSISQ